MSFTRCTPSRELQSSTLLYESQPLWPSLLFTTDTLTLSVDVLVQTGGGGIVWGYNGGASPAYFRAIVWPYFSTTGVPGAVTIDLVRVSLDYVCSHAAFNRHVECFR